MPSIGQEEIEEVIDSLRKGWLTSGPKVKLFESNFAEFVGVKHAIAVNSCTAALTVALSALGIRSGDEVIVPTLTFCATANVVEHLGATPVLVDVGEDFQIDPAAIERAITSNTRAIIPVHYAGVACDLDCILTIADRAGISVIQDGAHAVGTQYHGSRIGIHGQGTAFSFYPSKNMTTGEGGMLTTNDACFAGKVRSLAKFGIRPKQQSESWDYEVFDAGYKANMMDLQAAIGIAQLKRLESFIARRRQIASLYSAAFSQFGELLLPSGLPGRPHAYHLYTLRIAKHSRIDRNQLLSKLKDAGIGTSVHFVPLHRHPFYRMKYAYSDAQFPVSEKLFAEMLSLPIYPAMSEQDVNTVIEGVRSALV